MLHIEDLKTFLDQVKNDIPEISRVELLSNDSRFAKITKNIDKGEILLISILPSAKRKRNDEDHGIFKNKLAFLVVTRFDDRASKEEYLRTFIDTQQVILQFSSYLSSIKSDFAKKCIFKDFDLATEFILPVENYHSTNGWDLSITADTQVI